MYSDPPWFERQRPKRTLRFVLWLGLVSMLLFPSLDYAAAQTSSTPVDLSFSSSGQLSASLSVLDPNGSALRYAIDGNFTPLVDALSLNVSTRAQLLAQIAVVELNFPALFGNHDGQVTSNEVVLFQQLLLREASLLPGSSMVTGSSTVSLTLDGAGPVSSQLTSVQLTGATGPDSSNASIVIASDFVDQFAPSGTSHTLTISVNPSATSSIGAILAPTLELSFQAPSGYTVLGSTGLSGTTTMNDFFGLGAGSLTGTFAPGTTSQASIQFAASFPWGYVLIGLAVGAGGVVAALLWVRRRRRRRSRRMGAHSDPVGSTEGNGSVGPSGSE